ncbi:MAG: type II 3-dehydroquinate dehydratase [Actinobacteria bacterium]|nr:type II 3-dehydroquinate dehydratase [Actinomycetota bacterium]MTA29816.1 type II 3-dehydroquinate dehydratase [Actinomycetota bacterium]
MRKVLVLNGPNLGRLGSREPEIYGNLDFAALVAQVTEVAAEMGLQADVRQSDSETDLVHWLHEAVDQKLDVIINPAAFTHYSYALRDAAALVTSSGQKLIEVHISNPHAREQFRHTSVISGVATGVIAGLGLKSYLLALGAVV